MAKRNIVTVYIKEKYIATKNFCKLKGLHYKTFLNNLSSPKRHKYIEEVLKKEGFKLTKSGFIQVA